MQESRIASSSVFSFLERTQGLLIGGSWQLPIAAETLDVSNPATGEVMTRIARGKSGDIDLAVTAARKAFEGEWAGWSPFDRQKLLLRINDVVQANFDELAVLETMDMGTPIERTMALKRWLCQVILFYASQTHAGGTSSCSSSLPGTVRTFKIKAPVGVVGGIIPWNAALVSQWWILGPTLATGCTAVLKPAEDASLTCLRMAELLMEAGVPPGVLNVVTGLGAEAGAALASHGGVDRIAFTGSTETGRKIVEASSTNMKRVQLELGGKSPDIVFDDADLDKAVPSAVMGVFANSGQICFAGSRILVQRTIYDEFASRAREFSLSLKVGNGLDPGVHLGPVASAAQMRKVLKYIDIGKDEGATLMCGGDQPVDPVPEGGYFIQPTIFSDVDNDMQIAREEIFGPVACLIPFDSLRDALALANATPYGLAGGVWSRNLSRCHAAADGIRAGTIWVNCYGLLDPNVGFGGFKMSGYGWKAGPEHVDSFLYQKAVYMDISS